MLFVLECKKIDSDSFRISSKCISNLLKEKREIKWELVYSSKVKKQKTKQQKNKTTTTTKNHLCLLGEIKL